MFEGIKAAAKAAGMLIKANSPTILLVGGIGLGVATVVTTIAKSEDAVGIINELNERLETIKNAEESGVDFSTVPVGNGDEKLGTARKAKLIARLDAFKKLAKVYMVPMVIGVAAIACILGSYGILSKQKAALAGAYALLESKFSTYQDRVVEKFGAQADYDIMTGSKEEYVKEVVDGKEVEVLKRTTSDNLTDWTARVFDETTSTIWDPNQLVRKNNVIIAKNYANDILNARGWITLNEVYRMFGLEGSDLGVSAGWVKGVGDDQITCGIEDLSIENVRRFMNPYEEEVPEEGLVLRFNCLADIRTPLREYMNNKRFNGRVMRLAKNRGLVEC